MNGISGVHRAPSSSAKGNPFQINPPVTKRRHGYGGSILKDLLPYTKDGKRGLHSYYKSADIFGFSRHNLYYVEQMEVAN